MAQIAKPLQFWSQEATVLFLGLWTRDVFVCFMSASQGQVLAQDIQPASLLLINLHHIKSTPKRITTFALLFAMCPGIL